MSDIDTKAPAKPKSTAKKSPAKAASAKTAAAKFVEAALAKAERKNLMLKEITFTDQNARITPRTQDEIERWQPVSRPQACCRTSSYTAWRMVDTVRLPVRPAALVWIC